MRHVWKIVEAEIKVNIQKYQLRYLSYLISYKQFKFLLHLIKLNYYILINKFQFLYQLLYLFQLLKSTKNVQWIYYNIYYNSFFVLKLSYLHKKSLLVYL